MQVIFPLELFISHERKSYAQFAQQVINKLPLARAPWRVSVSGEILIVMSVGCVLGTAVPCRLSPAMAALPCTDTSPQPWWLSRTTQPCGWATRNCWAEPGCVWWCVPASTSWAEGRSLNLLLVLICIFSMLMFEGDVV